MPSCVKDCTSHSAPPSLPVVSEYQAEISEAEGARSIFSCIIEVTLVASALSPVTLTECCFITETDFTENDGHVTDMQ